jgi:hypothetical protein
LAGLKTSTFVADMLLRPQLFVMIDYSLWEVILA